MQTRDQLNSPTAMCSFCGSSRNDQCDMLSSPMANICADCAEMANAIFTDNREARGVPARALLDRVQDILLTPRGQRLVGQVFGTQLPGLAKTDARPST